MSARSFHNGYWWPLYTTDWYAPRVSQPVFDPYSLTHVLHGFIMQLAFGRFIGFWEGGLAIATGIETAWEVFENSEFVVERFRENSGTSGEYKGDSVQNIVGDILAMVVGYTMGTIFYTAGLWWLSLVSIAASEIFTFLYMRDSLFLVQYGLLFKNERLIEYQAAGIPKIDNLKYNKPEEFIYHSPSEELSVEHLQQIVQGNKFSYQTKFNKYVNKY